MLPSSRQRPLRSLTQWPSQASLVHPWHMLEQTQHSLNDNFCVSDVSMRQNYDEIHQRHWNDSNDMYVIVSALQVTWLCNVERHLHNVRALIGNKRIYKVGKTVHHRYSSLCPLTHHFVSFMIIFFLKWQY